jgi:hypothetical protein
LIAKGQPLGRSGGNNVEVLSSKKQIEKLPKMKPKPHLFFKWRTKPKEPTSEPFTKAVGAIEKDEENLRELASDHPSTKFCTVL